MNKMECYVIGDLLPLYIDNACSEQTAKEYLTTYAEI